MTLKVNVNGTWKDADSVSVNVGGTWKVADSVSVNVNGDWEEGYASGPLSLFDQFSRQSVNNPLIFNRLSFGSGAQETYAFNYNIFVYNPTEGVYFYGQSWLINTGSVMNLTPTATGYESQISGTIGTWYWMKLSGSASDINTTILPRPW